jgi:hypothetical protein
MKKDYKKLSVETVVVGAVIAVLLSITSYFILGAYNDINETKRQMTIDSRKLTRQDYFRVVPVNDNGSSFLLHEASIRFPILYFAGVVG